MCTFLFPERGSKDMKIISTINQRSGVWDALGQKYSVIFLSFFLSYLDVNCRAFRYGGRTNEETLAGT